MVPALRALALAAGLAAQAALVLGESADGANATTSVAIATSVDSVKQLSHSEIRNLFSALFKAFFSVFLGYICKRMQLVRPELGELKGMSFFVGRIAFPLLVFKTIIKEDFGSVDPWTILACFLGKATAGLLTWAIVFVAYKTARPVGQRWLSATVFSYFTVATDDFAVGFPVVDAVFPGQNLLINVAANAMVSQAVFTPLATALLNAGARFSSPVSVEGTGSENSAPPPDRWVSILVVAREVLMSPVVLMSLLGFLFKYALPFLVVKDAEGKVIQLVHPLDDVVELIASHFTEMALFLSGTALQAPRFHFWSILLVTMNMVCCSYASYYFTYLLVQGQPITQAEVLRSADFSYIYGMVPANGAPLLFARQFDPSAADTVATGQLFALALAGPLMFCAAIFDEATGDLRSVLIPVELQTAIVSLVSGAIIVVMLLILRGKWGYADPSKFTIAALVAVRVAHEAITIAMNPEISLGPCRAYNMDPRTSAYGISLSALQHAGHLLMLLNMRPGRFMQGGQSVKLGAPLVAMALLAGLAMGFFTVPQTVPEMCSLVHLPEAPAENSLIPNLVTTILYLTVFVIFSGLWIMRGSSDRHCLGSLEEPSPEEPSPEDGAVAAEGPREEEDVGLWLAQQPKSIVKGMAFTQVALVALQLVNTSTVMSGDKAEGSFALMLVLETLLQHGQLVILLGLLVADTAYCRHFMSVTYQRLPWLLRRAPDEDDEVDVGAMASEDQYVCIQRLASVADYSVHPDDVGQRTSMMARRRSSIGANSSMAGAAPASRPGRMSNDHADLDC